MCHFFLESVQIVLAFAYGLNDASVTWTDLAVALYNLNTEVTDDALMELKHRYLPNTG